MPTHDLFCVTHGPDADFTRYMLRSVQKYCRGFRQVVLVYPEQHETEIQGAASGVRNVALRPVRESGVDGHMHQNFLKCCPDTFSDADYFHHIDSDVSVDSLWRPEDSFTLGKPDLLFTPYATLNGGSPWRGITENALGFSCPNETMRRFPFTYPRFLYGELRKHVEALKKMPFQQWVYTAPGIDGAFRGFSEFNALGSFAMAKFPGEFHMYNTDTHMKPNHVTQRWSFWCHPRHSEHADNWPRCVNELEFLTTGWEQAA